MTPAATTRQRVLTATAFAGLLIACVFMILRLSVERQEVLEDFRRSTWLPVQAQTEFLRLAEALSRYEATPSRANHQEAEQRFDVFWSRFPLFTVGTENEQLKRIQGIPELIADINAQLPRARAAIAGIDPAQPATFAAAHQAIEQFRAPLQSLVAAALDQSTTTGRARIERQYAWILAALVAVLASGALLVARLRREARNAQANYEMARRAQTEASDLKERLVDALESISEGFILLDSTGRVVMANSRYRELYPAIAAMVEPGVAFQDLVWAGAALHQFGSEEPVENLVRERMERLAKPNGPFEQLLDDGRVLLVNERRTGRGSLVSVGTDITELKRTQHALQNRLAAMEASIDGIAIIEVGERLVGVNRAFAEIFGFRVADEMIGRRWAALFDDAENSRFAGEIQPKLRADGRWRGERRARRQDGTQFPLEVSMTILEDGGMICIARDATEQHRAAAERQQLQDQFYQAQKMEALGRLSGGIAHDFNNILAAIIGYSTFLLEDLPEGSETQGFARQILAAGNRAKDLVQQILAFSRTHDARRDAIDLAAVVNETLTMLSATMPATVALTEAVAADGMIVSADATQIGQVLMNLCVNARDALPGDRGRIAVELARIDMEGGWAPGLADGNAASHEPVLRLRSDSDGRHTRMWVGMLAKLGPCVRLTVHDTGSGMERTVMERMFEPFFTTKSVGKGTGLGLAAVHGIIAAHGGAVIVESVIGEGSRFDIFLPLAEASAEIVEQVPETRVAQGRELVLLVDDEAHVAAMTTRCLERLGYEVASCEDPKDALESFEDDPQAWDIVVTDQTMPGLTGMELAKRMLERRPDLPIVLCTGFSETATEEAARAAGIAAFLTKPIDPDKLTRTVRAVLDRDDAGAARPAECRRVTETA